MSFYNSTLYWPRADEGCEWSWKPFLLCVLPQVEKMRDAYQTWIGLPRCEQRMSKSILRGFITYRDQGGERVYRMIRALIETFEEWSTMQDSKGACGFSPSLTIITENFEADLTQASITFGKVVRKARKLLPLPPRTPSPSTPAPPRSSPSSAVVNPLDSIPISSIVYPPPSAPPLPGYGDAALSSPPPNSSKRSKMDDQHYTDLSGTGDTFSAHLNETFPVPASLSSSAADCYDQLITCIDPPRFDVCSDEDENENEYLTASSAGATGSGSSVGSLDSDLNVSHDSGTTDRIRRSMSISPIRCSSPVDLGTFIGDDGVHEQSISADKENITPRPPRDEL